MEGIPPPPVTGDGLLFVLNTAQCDHAHKHHIVGTSMQRLPTVKSAVRGQPLFLFDADARELHGPYAADGPGGLNLEGGNSRMPAQIRFGPVVRNFSPLPESMIADLLNFDPGSDGKGRRPASCVEGATVTHLLWLFVLHHHGMYEALDMGASSDTEAAASGSATLTVRAAAVLLAAFLRDRIGHEIQATSMGDFYASLASPAQGDECRELMRRAVAPGMKRGVQSFVHQNADLLSLRGAGKAMAIVGLTPVA